MALKNPGNDLREGDVYLQEIDRVMTFVRCTRVRLHPCADFEALEVDTATLVPREGPLHTLEFRGQPHAPKGAALIYRSAKR